MITSHSLHSWGYKMGGIIDRVHLEVNKSYWLRSSKRNQRDMKRILTRKMTHWIGWRVWRLLRIRWRRGSASRLTTRIPSGQQRSQGLVAWSIGDKEMVCYQRASIKRWSKENQLNHQFLYLPITLMLKYQNKNPSRDEIKVWLRSVLLSEYIRFLFFNSYRSLTSRTRAETQHTPTIKRTIRL